ncbi:MAG: VCBS repeat-containing protein [Patescibacteria group bacterium]|nr:VCBS repeat-containing protein [Patescibacteria group bacterium]
MTKTKIKTKPKTKTMISIALLAFIISGLGLAAGIFYNVNYPKSKCKNAFKIVKSSKCQGSYKKYTVVSFCSKNKTVQKLAIKKLKKNKKCYKSYKIIKKKACKSYYNKTIKLYCPKQTENNINQNINQPNESNNSTNSPIGENASLNQNESTDNTDDNVSIDDPIDEEFEDIEDELPAEPITDLEDNLADINLINKPGWPKNKNHDNEKIQSIIAANIDNQGSKEIINQSLIDGYSTLRLYAWQNNGQLFNNNWPIEITNCPAGCVPNQQIISHNFKAVNFQNRVSNFATPISIGKSNEIITSIYKAGPPGFWFHDLFSFNKDGQNNSFWPKTKEKNTTNLIISNLENNQNTNVLFGSSNNTYILNNQGADIFNNLSNKKSFALTIDDSIQANPKLISLGFDSGSPTLQIYDTAGNNLPSFPKQLPELKSYSSSPSLTLSDLNNDGSREIIILGEHTQDGLYLNAIQNNGNSLSGFPIQISANLTSDSGLKISSADIDQDNNNEIVLFFRNTDENIITFKIINYNATVSLTSQLPGNKFSEPLLANLNNDNNLEIVTTIDNSLYIIDTAELAFRKIDAAGDDPNEFGYFPTVFLTDLDNNNRIDFVSNIGNKTNAWELNFSTNNMPWPMPDQNNQRTRIAP